MRKLLLVDGSNLLFQMFFGMPSRIVNSQGKMSEEENPFPMNELEYKYNGITTNEVLKGIGLK